jgi:hypothetical protein
VADERVWLGHAETGGHFYCPVEAVEDWLELGWQPSDAPPEEPNPVVAERLAWEAAQLAAQAAEAEATRTKKGRTSGADTTPQEG